MNLTQKDKLCIIDFSKLGYTSRQIASILGFSKSTVNNVLSKERKQLPKVLFLDVESAPAIAVAFSRYDVNITQNHILQEGNWLLSIAWKWDGAKKSQTEGMKITSKQAKQQDDFELVRKMKELIDEADIVIAHNAKGFDMKILKSRLVVHMLPMFHAAKVIDTLQIAKQMKFPANSLDALAAHLDIGRKTETGGINLWIDCMKGDSKALKTMLQYNKDDVDLLVKVYSRLQPYNSTTPNFGIYSDDSSPRCMHCGSVHVDYTGDLVYTNLGAFAEVRCGDCGAVSKNRQNLLSKNQRSKQLGKA